MGALEDFRMETREWLTANCPASMRESAAEDQMIGGGKKQKYKKVSFKTTC